MTDQTVPLTEEQKMIAKTFLDEFDNLCLVSAYIPKWDKQVALIATHSLQENGEVFIGPVAIVITEDLFPEIVPPEGMNDKP